MTLAELSVEYRAHAQTLKERLGEVEQQLQSCNDPKEQEKLQQRFRLLGIMQREARELAVLTERYYERGYRRNAKYTI